MPHAFFKTPEFAALSGRAVKLLLELALQYSGSNNGDLCATHSVLRSRGFTSSDQLQKARDELVDSGWIQVSRQGGRHACTLYALTFHPVDRCGGKIDLKPGPASHLWKAQNGHLREKTVRKRRTDRSVRENGANRVHRDTVHIEPPHGVQLDRNTEQGNQN